VQEEERERLLEERESLERQIVRLRQDLVSIEITAGRQLPTVD